MIKMTEKKRFSWEVIDHDCLFYDNEELIDYDDVVDLLNELNEKNNQLKFKLNQKESLIQQLKNELDTDCYKEAEHYRKEFIRVCEELAEENQELMQKKNDLKDLLVNSETVLEQKELQKIIHKRVCAAIDNKINEFKNGDYGDLPCNTINMLLDLKMEIEQW